MDPGGIGALIGIGIMAGAFIGLRLCDLYTKRKARQLPRKQAKRLFVVPSVSKEQKQPILVIKRHWKMKDLSLPNSYILHNLTVRKF